MIVHSLSHRFIFASVLVFVSLSFGCNAENPTDQNDGPGNVWGGTAGSGGAANPGGTGGSGAAGYGAGGTSGSQAGTGVAPGEWVQIGGGQAGACAAFSSTATRVEVQKETEVPYEVTEAEPVAIYIMLDQSGSMWIPDFVSISFKWVVAVDAVTTFVNDPASANIDVALQYFPLGGAPCDGTIYDTPAVPMGRLPGHATAITNSLGTVMGTGSGTPIEPALRGATRYCAGFKTDPVANPEGLDCAVVLITDGQPTECNADPVVLSGVAADALNNDGVTTFAVGMAGADFYVLNMIAQAGGQDCDPAGPNFACDVSTGTGMTLVQALEIIRSYITTMETRIEYETVVETQALECEWEIPEPPEGESFDRDKLNLEFSATGADADKQIIAMAASADACGDALAWHYDNPTAPARVIACPKTCETIQAAATGAINILLGCEVVILE